MKLADVLVMIDLKLLVRGYLENTLCNTTPFKYSKNSVMTQALIYWSDSYKNCRYLASRFGRPFVCFSHYFYWDLGLSGGKKRRPKVRLRPRINLHDCWKFTSANSTVLDEKVLYIYVHIHQVRWTRDSLFKGWNVNECSGLVAPTLSESWLIFAVDWSFT